MAIARACSGKNASKHDIILKAATQVFLDRGYGLASMDAIACRAKVSKQTIYSHFGGKASLFGAIIERKCAQLTGPMLSEKTRRGTPEKVLRDIAGRFLKMMLDPGNMANFRIVIAESWQFPELAEAFYSSGPESAVKGLSDYLTEQNDKNMLSINDPIRSARLFFSMLRDDLYIRRLLGIGAEPTARAIGKTIDLAVVTFLATHARRP